MMRSLMRVSELGLLGLYLIAAVGIFGFGFFTLNPQNLAAYPAASSIYGGTFSFFAQAQIYLAAVTFVLFLIPHLGSRWVPLLITIAGIGFVSEYFGTSQGIPFGDYEYTSLLGVKLLERVPIGIPLSWFFMGFASYLLARRLARGRLAVCLWGSFILMAWDFSLDPAMSSLTSYWVWEESGVYYGTPIKNFVGWYVTGLVIMAVCDYLVGADADAVPLGFVVLFYGANLLMPFGMILLAGLPLAIALTVGSYLSLYYLFRLKVGVRKLSQGGVRLEQLADADLPS